jgi:hypothetical protein
MTVFFSKIKLNNIKNERIALYIKGLTSSLSPRNPNIIAYSIPPLRVLKISYLLKTSTPLFPHNGKTLFQSFKALPFTTSRNQESSSSCQTAPIVAYCQS